LFGFSLFLPFFVFVFLFFLFLLCIKGFWSSHYLLGFWKLTNIMVKFAHCYQPTLCTKV
jgi:hypothetical protein